MFWSILLFLFFVFTPKALANDVSVSITNGATSGNINTQFDIQVKVTASTAGTYYVSADNSSSCTVDLLYESASSWSNGCYIGTNVMKQIIVGSDGGSNTDTLRLRDSASGTKTIRVHVYDSAKTLLATSADYSVTINAITPTNTPTNTPTPTPTGTSTPTPTPTKVLTPTPTEKPVIEPTQAPEITVAPTVKPVDTEESSDDSEKSGLNLPVILIILGLLMFIGPVVLPKIIEKIKSKKRKGPPVEPPHFQLPPITTTPPTQIPSVGEDPTISNFQ
jgi:hypothetical protein